jgi:DNA polymerase-3 subunit alpha
MKIAKVAIQNNGMTQESAEALWDDIEGFAAYSFNKSHAVEYSVISFWTMWLKTYYPTQFFAACLTILPEDKHAGLVKDAFTYDILIMPPDLNLSSNRFEIVYDKGRAKNVLYMPFQSIKGVSEKGAREILEAKKSGPFKDVDDFLDRVNKRVVNKRVQESLRLVGATASLDPAEPHCLHPDRLKNQKALLGALMRTDVKADRVMMIDDLVRDNLLAIYKDVQECDKCSLAGQCHPMPKFGAKPKFMVIVDSPNFSEDDKGEMMASPASDYLKTAIKEAGLKVSDGYYAALVKSKKPKGAKLDNDMINGCVGYIAREIEALKPAIIVCMGGTTIRHFSPDVKGSWSELVGQTHYDAKLDATLVYGINPAMVYIDNTKQKVLDQVMKQVAELIQ